MKKKSVLSKLVELKDIDESAKKEIFGGISNEYNFIPSNERPQFKDPIEKLKLT